MFRLSLLTLFLATGTLAFPSDLQQWTNKEGKQIEASFRGIKDDHVQLADRNGRSFTYPIINLSLESQAKLKELQKDVEIAHLPPLYRNRIGAERRTAALEKHGGDPRIIAAIERGLASLASRQNPEGSFAGKYSAACTGLSLLSFLAHGETTESQEYGSLVTEAVRFLIKQSEQNDGLLSNGDPGHHECYEHAIATQALVEALTLTQKTAGEIPGLESVVKKSLGLITDGICKSGGWAYGYQETTSADLSLSNWQIQALWLAKESGIDFPKVDETLEKGIDFVMTMQDSEGAFKYRPDIEKGKPTLTAGALFSLRNGGRQQDTVYTQGLAYLTKAYSNPSPGSNYYAPYFNTLALFHDEGGHWDAYRDTFFPKLLDAQNTDGSWKTSGPADEDDKEILGTAWAILMLESFYRYDKESLSL